MEFSESNSSSYNPIHRFTRTVVQERRAQLLHRGEPEGPDTTGGEAKKKKRVADFIDLLLLSRMRMVMVSQMRR